MNLNLFLTDFGHIASAPEGVYRLREMIYSLAITGALSEQRRSDGDGHSLLTEIAAKKQALSDAGVYKRTTKLENLRDAFKENLPKIPTTWAWSRLVECGEISPKNEVEDETIASFASMSAISEMHSSAVASEDRPWGNIKKGYTHFANGDVVLAKITPCFENGKAAVMTNLTNGIGAGTTELHVVRPIAGLIEPGYIYAFLRSPYFKIVGEGHMTGTAGQKRLPTEFFATRPFPLPPLAEQKRIVAKVDELMALCDQLEAQQQERERRFPVLSRTCHTRFAEAPTHANLNRIFDETGNVSPVDLRKTILALAVEGVLVPQIPTDEPATLLIERIKETSSNQINRRVSKRRDLSIQEPFPLPPGWAWGRFPELGEFGRGKSKHRPRNDTRLYTNGTYKLVQTGDVARAHGTILTHTGLYNEVGLAQSKLWPEGTLCITIAANIADSGILGFDACFPDSVVGFVPSKSIPSVRYFEYFMRTAKEAISKFAPATAQKNINLGILEQVQIPIPPANEQRRIVAKVDELMALVDQLEAQQQERDKLAAAFAKACVTSFTGTTQLERPEKMKAPKTELVSLVTLGTQPMPDGQAPLAHLLSQANGTLPAKSLWQQSGLTIDAFYQQLKTEIAHGWIALPVEAEMKVVE